MSRTRPGRLELLAVGALLGVILVATFVTVWRVPTGELYHLSVGGLHGGFGRALVELNFPDALIAVPVALIAVAVLRARWAAILAAVAIAACLVVDAPGVIDQDDLDAKAVNAIP